LGEAPGCGIEEVKRLIESGFLTDPDLGRVSDAFKIAWVVVDESHGCHRGSDGYKPYLSTLEAVPLAYPARFVFRCSKLNRLTIVDASIPLYMPLELAGERLGRLIMERVMMNDPYASLRLSGVKRKLELSTLFVPRGDIASGLLSAVMNLISGHATVTMVLEELESELDSEDSEKISNLQAILLGAGIRNLVEAVQKLREGGLAKRKALAMLDKAGYSRDMAEAVVEVAYSDKPIDDAFHDVIRMLQAEDSTRRLYR